MTEAESIDDNPARGTFDWPRFGRMLKYLRDQRGLRLEDVSKATGVPLTALSNMEKGRPATVENMIPLCVLWKLNPCKLHSSYVDPNAPPAPPPATDLLPPPISEGIEIGGNGLPVKADTP